jgi:hypothetical protein
MSGLIQWVLRIMLTYAADSYRVSLVVKLFQPPFVLCFFELFTLMTVPVVKQRTIFIVFMIVQWATNVAPFVTMTEWFLRRRLARLNAISAAGNLAMIHPAPPTVPVLAWPAPSSSTPVTTAAAAAATAAATVTLGMVPISSTAINYGLLPMSISAAYRQRVATRHMFALVFQLCSQSAWLVMLPVLRFGASNQSYPWHTGRVTDTEYQTACIFTTIQMINIGLQIMIVRGMVKKLYDVDSWSCIRWAVARDWRMLPSLLLGAFILPVGLAVKHSRVMSYFVDY